MTIIISNLNKNTTHQDCHIKFPIKFFDNVVDFSENYQDVSMHITHPIQFFTTGK